ncbi:MAG TPA: S53 family peptidase [Candidatus Acidoferrales bacterium]|nr:S53 family peptidase [Candidatus Acidoferrales bacterium]
MQRVSITITAALSACLAFTAARAAAAPVAVPLSLPPGAAIAAPVPAVAYRDLGEAPPSTPISIAVVLAYRQPERLEQLVDVQSAPGSPYFRHWLTSAQFAAAFGPTPVDEMRTMIALRAAGFTIVRRYSNRTVIDARGSASDAEHFFQTRIHRVFQPGVGLRYSNVAPAVVPFALRNTIFAVNGLNDLSIVHADFMPTGRARRPRALKARPPYTGPISSATALYGYGPLAFAQAYDFGTQHSGSTVYNGSGRTAAIVIDADFLDADVANFLSFFNITRTAAIARIPIDGGTTSDPGLTSDSVETTLDVETLAANAPGAAIDVYETAPFTWGLGVVTDAYEAIVSANQVDSVNSSFGLCDTADPAASKTWDHLATQAATLGMTFHASSGDGGSACGAGTTGVNAPASSPHVVAVGGTTLDLDAKKHFAYETELGWTGSGGGISAVFAMPAWQQGVKGMLGKGRNVPDVAMDADPYSGTAFYYAQTWNNPWDPLGGTSLSSPLFGAALMQIDQIVGGRTGLAAQRLYDLWKSVGYAKGGVTYFHDVVKGSNGLYSATTGYDRVTGIGSLDVWNVAQSLK